MKTAIVKLKSLSPYNQSRQHFSDKAEGGKESPDAYEKRTWREKGHYDSDGNAFIPPMALKNAVTNAAKMLSIPVPNRGKALYTKHFVSGLLVTESIPLGVKKDQVKPQWVSCDPRGQKGGMGVLRAFPHFEKWQGEAKFIILDDTITKEVFERVVRESGNFVGIGQFRPQNGGYFGRYEVQSIKWE